MVNTESSGIRRCTIIMYLTIAIAALESLWLELGTTDGGHEIFSMFFFAELLLLGTMLAFGLASRWSRVVITLLLLFETVLFILDTPIGPDALPMILIFTLRIYVLISLFRHPTLPSTQKS